MYLLLEESAAAALIGLHTRHFTTQFYSLVQQLFVTHYLLLTWQ